MKSSEPLVQQLKWAQDPSLLPSVGTHLPHGQPAIGKTYQLPIHSLALGQNLRVKYIYMNKMAQASSLSCRFEMLF
jgi:hypothetical protein